MTVDEARANIGREVRYQSFPGDAPEFGIIRSVNDHGTVFVQYHGQIHNKGTYPEDLELCGWKAGT